MYIPSMQAEGRCVIEDCDSPSLTVKEEYLYLRPSFDNDFISAPNIDAQVPFNLHPGGPGKKNKFDYTSGYRMSVSYENPSACLFLNNGCLRFTYLPARSSRKMSLESFLASLIVSPTSCEDPVDPPSVCGSLSSHQYLNYYGGDVSTSYDIFNDCGLNFSVQPGLHYAWMSYHSHVFVSSHAKLRESNHASLKEKSETWGIGPQLGFKLNYELYQWLTLKGGMFGGLLYSRASTHFNMELSHEVGNSTDSVDLLDPKKTSKIFPFWETNVGLAISFYSYGYQLEVEVGYEYLTYPNFINRIGFPGLRTADKADNAFTTFDFQGPYVSLAITF